MEQRYFERIDGWTWEVQGVSWKGYKRNTGQLYVVDTDLIE